MPFQLEPLKDILVCPKSKSPLVQTGDALICTDAECRLKFAIRDDIPVMLLDEAIELSTEEWSAAMDAAAERVE